MSQMKKRKNSNLRNAIENLESQVEEAWHHEPLHLENISPEPQYLEVPVPEDQASPQTCD